VQNIIDCISEVLEIELTVSDFHLKLSDIEEWDSISMLGLMAKADEDFGVVLTPQLLDSAQSIGDLVDLLGGKR
jgi:acyl carrier protein